MIVKYVNVYILDAKLNWGDYLDQKKIAAIAGVSAATVSRVVNNDPRVSEKTRGKVSKVLNEYAYVQNMSARNLRTARSNAIGFLISNLSNPFFIEAYEGLEPVCKKYGYSIIVGNTNEDISQEREAIELLLRYRVDGIVASFVDPDDSTIQKLTKLNINLLMLDRSIKIFDTDTVTVDNIGGGGMQIEYLHRLGHREIGLIHGTTYNTPGAERLHGSLEAMKELGIEIRQEYITCGEFTEDGAYRAVKRLMGLPSPPKALVTHNNLMSMGAYKALKDLGIYIPQQISLIGFDDFGLAEYLTPGLTVIDRPIREMGEMAANMLIQRIEGKYTETSRKIVFPVHLRVRGSCVPPAF